MSPINDKNRKPKFKKEIPKHLNIGGDCEQYPTFSFRHLTTNSNFNFNYFNTAQAREMQTMKHKLYDRIEEICKNNCRYWGSLNKRNGYETIEYSRLEFQPSDLVLLKDEKVFIFRLNNNARIIGYRKGKCPIFHIIGYDFNFAAYNHGS